MISISRNFFSIFEFIFLFGQVNFGNPDVLTHKVAKKKLQKDRREKLANGTLFCSLILNLSFQIHLRLQVNVARKTCKKMAFRQLGNLGLSDCPWWRSPQIQLKSKLCLHSMVVQKCTCPGRSFTLLSNFSQDHANHF